MEDEESNGDVPGFEDLDDDGASRNDMGQGHLRLECHVNEELDGEVVKETLIIQINSNFEKKDMKSQATVNKLAFFQHQEPRLCVLAKMPIQKKCLNYHNI